MTESRVAHETDGEAADALPDDSAATGAVVAASRPVDAAPTLDAALRAGDRDALAQLYDLTRHLASAATVEALAASVAARLLDALPRATHVTFFLPRADGSLAPRFMHQRHDAGVASERHAISRTLLERVVERREALLVADASAALEGSASVAEAQIHATLCVPLFARERLSGVLQIDDRHRMGSFSERDLELVTVFGEQLATVLENTALRERLARAEAELRHENQALRASLETTLIADSRAMREVQRRIELAARENLPLLIAGETGTGKEVVARTVHALSPRHAGPFVPVNCAALPRELAESELFGHARGAFSGATAPRPGLFREASGGTLFLDEITELPLELQAKLLRAVEGGTVRSVGADRELPVDARIVAATNRDPEAEADAGRFRRDLFYRLDVLRIELPPLRQRTEDIPALADHLLARYRAASKRVVGAIDPSALDALLAHDWPGNVRELRNEIERAAAFTPDGEPIQLETLSPRLRARVAGPVPAAEPGSAPAEPAEAGVLRDVVEVVERRLILATLARFDHNITRAAEHLGLSRPGLRARMQRYGIARPDSHDVPDP